MKKLLFVWTDLVRGGAEKALLNLAAELNKNYQVKILLCYNKIEFDDLDKTLNIEYIVDNISFKFISHLKIFLRIFMSILNNDVTIVYEIPLLTFLTGIIGRILFTKKIIYWIHVCKSEIKQTNSLFLLKFIQKTLTRAKCVCVSETCKISLNKFISKHSQNIEVIYNLIGKESLPPQNKPEPDNTIKISALGRLSREKRFDVLIKAMALLLKKDKNLNITLDIAGNGSEKVELKKLILSLSLDDYVHIIDTVSKPLEFLNSSDIFISSSESEALPYNVVEALACQKPVIVTDTGAAEIIEYGKYGIVVEKNNPEKLANAIYDLATNPQLRNELSAKSYLALEKFDNKKSLRQWINLLEKE